MEPAKRLIDLATKEINRGKYNRAEETIIRAEILFFNSAVELRDVIKKCRANSSRTRKVIFNHKAAGSNSQQEMEPSESLIDLAAKEINCENYDKAEEVIRKAEIMFSNSAAELRDIIKKFRCNSSETNQSSSHGRFKSRSSESEGSPVTSSATSSPGDSPRGKQKQYEAPFRERKSYTESQIELVRSIYSCKNFYQVLCVSKDATDVEIKKAYKRLALQLHPDKNNAPGAAEAFKILGNAVSVLTDKIKRREYDASGADTIELGSNNTQANANDNYNLYNPYEDDAYADELFNMFFASCPNQRPNATRNQQRESTRSNRTTRQGTSTFILIVICIAISLVLTYLTSDPIYSLRQSSHFPIKRETQHLSVPYFVRKNFKSDFQGSVKRLEASVEDDYIFTMKQNCFRERTYREAMLSRARTFGNRLLFAQAQELKLPSCENLAKIGITRFSLY